MFSQSFFILFAGLLSLSTPALDSERAQLEAKLETKDFAVERLERLLQITYQQEDWASFFSYALSYRLRFPAETWKPVYLLEPLALVRHCQVQPLNQLIEDLEILRPQDQAQLEKVRLLAEIEFTAKKTDSNPNSKVSEWIKAKSLWPASLKELEKRNPSSFRIRVENRCS